MNTSSLNKTNPSRKECEDIIRRILLQEVEQRNRNCHFRHSVDFLPFFESLYPSSVGLAKQVQRAVHSLNLPKDSNGFYIINRSEAELSLESHLKCFFQYEKATLYKRFHPDYAEILCVILDPTVMTYCKDRLTKYFQYSIPDLVLWNEGLELCCYSSTLCELETLFQRIGVSLLIP